MSEEQLERIAVALERLAEHFAPVNKAAETSVAVDQIVENGGTDRQAWWRRAVAERKAADEARLSAVDALIIRMAHGEITNPGALRMTESEITRLKAIADRFAGPAQPADSDG